MPYLTLLRSFLGWFESRGESASSARFGTAAAMAVFLCINLTTALLLTVGLVGRRHRYILDIFDSVPLNIMGLATALAFNWWLIGKIKVRAARGLFGGSITVSTPKYLWAWYTAASIALLFVGIALAIRR
jgi:hypothetical protein